MYGFVNRAIELLVSRKFGQDVWEQVKREAGIELPSHFLVRVTYPDSITYALVGAAEKVLKVPAAAILELFGAFFYEFCVESGYDRILQVLGSTTADFLNNLDALHDHLATIYPGMRAPSFRCTNVENGIILHYYSERPGLEPIVVGLVKTVAKELHGSTVRVTVNRAKASDGTKQDHVQFLIQEENDGKQQSGTTISGNEHPPAQGLPINAARGTNSVLNTTNAMDAAMLHESLTSRLSSSTTTAAAGDNKQTQPDSHFISPDTFAMLFPFHIMFDRNLQVIQAGSSICRLLPQLTSPNCFIDGVFDLVRPRLDFTFESLLSHINTITILETKEGLLGYAIHVDGHARHLRLKGQMIHLGEHDSIVFVTSPSVTSLDDMVAHSIKLSDVPVHDATRDLVLMSEHWSHEYKLAQNLEYFIDMLQQTYKALDEEKKKTDNLLYSVLPPTVAARLKQNQPVPAQRYRAVTLLFTGIVGFNEYCRMHGGSRGAMIIVKTLNMVFSAIDVLVDLSKGKVYKVETVQDHYVAVSGLPEPCDDHAKAVAELALNLIDATADFFDDEGNAIKITIGIHSGEIVSGVIGNKAPRYCLFGNAVNIASRTLTCGVSEGINVSETTYDFLTNNQHCCDENNFQLQFRGEVEMKGKATAMKCYLLSRKPVLPVVKQQVEETVTLVVPDVAAVQVSQKPPASPRKFATATAPPMLLEIALHPSLDERTPSVVYQVTTPDFESPPASPLAPKRRTHPAATTVHRTSRITNQIAAVDIVRAQQAQKAIPISSSGTETYSAPLNVTKDRHVTLPATVSTVYEPSASGVTGDSKRSFLINSQVLHNSSNNIENFVHPINQVPFTKSSTLSDQQRKNQILYQNGPTTHYNTIASSSIGSNSVKQLPRVVRASNHQAASTTNLTRHQYYSPETQHRRPVNTHSSSRPVRFHTHDNNYYLPQDERVYASRDLANNAASTRAISTITMHHARFSTAVLPPRNSPKLSRPHQNRYMLNNSSPSSDRRDRFLDRGIVPNDSYVNNNNNSNNGTQAANEFDSSNEEQVYVRVKPSSSITTPLHVTRAVQVVSYTPAFVNTSLVQAESGQVHAETKGRPRWRLYKVTRV